MTASAERYVMYKTAHRAKQARSANQCGQSSRVKRTTMCGSLRQFRRVSWGLPVLAAMILPTSVQAQWPQWGGRDRDFSVDVQGLADEWPEGGPKRLWERPLGDGYTTILADGGLLYTMYRVGDDEFTVALDANTGKTTWEQKNAAPVDDQRSEHGPGPYATPLIVGDRLFTVGTNSVMHCYDKKTGSVHWQHDLVAEFDAVIQGFGFSSSPIAYRNTVIIPVGRKLPGEAADAAKKGAFGREQVQSLMAFDQQSGSLLWDNRSYDTTKHTSTYSSPMLIKFAGRDQLVLFMAKELAGLDPANGDRLWGVAHTTDYDENVSTPVWDGVDTLFISSAYGTGSRAIRLTLEDGKTVAKELWHTKKMRVLHGNVVRIGDYVYGSTGDFGPCFLACIDLASGKLAWRERGFQKATCIHADGKVIILDEDGQLALTTASPEDLTIHSRCNLELRGAWATPTLVGKTLFVRDRTKILALDLS